MYKILIIDDEPAMIRLMKNALLNESYEIHTRNSINEINLCDFMGFDLILLDLVMPNSGVDICKMIRKEIKIPIIFISARNTEESIIKCITAGGDDFIAKPFSVKELKARVKMHLRREERHITKKNSVYIGDRLIEISDLKVVINDNSFFLTKKEYNIIKLLSDNPSRVFSSEEIYDCVYPLSTDTQIRSVSEYIYQIRKKFKPFGLDPFLTVWGGGYSWKR